MQITFDDIIGLIHELINIDFFMKYTIIICNFMIIIMLLLIKRRKSLNKNNNSTELKRILIVTAHPDDEAMYLPFMFFIPTITELSKDYAIDLLCLSNGNADGLGKIREKELEKCCKYLKINHVDIINDERIQDGFKQHWDIQLLRSIIMDVVKKNQINALITFDSNGISGHPNHISVSKAVSGLKSMDQANSHSQQQEEYVNYIKDKKIKIFALKDVGLIRKYIGLLEFFLIFWEDWIFINLNIFKSYKAMSLHYSQWVWFRKLFVMFSRYTFFNTLREIQQGVYMRCNYYSWT